MDPELEAAELAHLDQRRAAARHLAELIADYRAALLAAGIPHQLADELTVGMHTSILEAQQGEADDDLTE